MVRGEASNDEIKEWSTWIEESDANRKKAKEALIRIYGFEFNDPELPNIEQKWSELSLDTSNHAGEPRIHFLGNFKENIWIGRVAAILIIISIVAAGMYLYSNQLADKPGLEQITLKKKITTADDETKTLKFSDGAKITLNSNSRLIYIYNEEPSSSSSIEVTLNGNAFFESGKSTIPAGSRFSISTPDGFIRDIGTEFLVDVENELTRVVMQEGIVEVKPRDNGDSGKEIYIKKGELVEFNSKDLTKRSEVNPTFFTSWATGFMRFDETQLKEVAAYLQNHYEVTVHFARPELSDLTLNGAIYYRSLEELVRAISDVTKVPVFQSKNKKTIFIGNPDETNN